MDNGASSYRRFLEGDDNGIVEIIRDHQFPSFIERSSESPFRKW